MGLDCISHPEPRHLSHPVPHGSASPAFLHHPPLRRRPTPVLHEGPPKPVPLLQGDPQVAATGKAPCPSRAVTAPSPESRAPHPGGSAGLACPSEGTLRHVPRLRPGPHPPAQQRPWAPAPALSRPLWRCRLSRQSSVVGVKTETAPTSGCWATCPPDRCLGGGKTLWQHTHCLNPFLPDMRKPGKPRTIHTQMKTKFTDNF